MTESPTAELQAPETTPPEVTAPEGGATFLQRWTWPLIVVGFLSFSVCTQAILITLAVSDPSHRVEEDYYQRALDYDSVMEQARTNAELGWSAELSAAPTPQRERVIELRLSDNLGAPLADAEVHLEAYHDAAANRVFRARLYPTSEPGRYQAGLRMRRAGRWTTRLVVHRGPVTVTSDTKLNLEPLP